MILSNIFANTRALVFNLHTSAPKKETGKYGGANYRKLMIDAANEIDRLVILNMSYEQILNDFMDKLEMPTEQKTLVLSALIDIYIAQGLEVAAVHKKLNT